MKALVVGATGATGRLLTRLLLDEGVQVKALVRSRDHLPAELAPCEGLQIIQGTVLEFSESDLQDLVQDCEAMASCLGHNLSFKGIYGPPRRLVRDSIQRLCTAARKVPMEEPRRVVLMNTAGNRHRGLHEPVSTAQRAILWTLRKLVPPHADNEDAAEFLRADIKQGDPQIEWVAVRPDGLKDIDQVTDYDLHPSPTRSAIFDAGETSRINVAHFMASLITQPELWASWRGQMPVIYNRPVSEGS